MTDLEIARPPALLDAILLSSRQSGFTLASERQTGSLLRALAASKPAGRLLELGTGTGVGSAWLLDGMDADARLDSVDSDPTVLGIARRHLGDDPRVTFHHSDGGAFLACSAPALYDLIFADTWPGKFTHLDAALGALRSGGVYVIDDLLPQSNWPVGHADRIPPLIDSLERRADLATVKLAWASGLMLVVKRARPA